MQIKIVSMLVKTEYLRIKITYKSMTSVLMKIIREAIINYYFIKLFLIWQTST